MSSVFDDLRAQMREEYYARQFLLGGWPGGTDTYKRTMWAAVPDIALAGACYTLTFRKGLPEPGAGNQLIMAGHEAVLAQWFHRPLRRQNIELAREWYTTQSKVRAFPSALWQSVLDAQRGEDIHLPVDIDGFPGGQTFLAGVPALSFTGVGGIISYLEPAMCRYFAPVIQATKARLMREATPRDAEFGLRAAPGETAHLTMLLARAVGAGAGGGRLTSNDTAEFLFPELFEAVGTIGHEMMSANQSFDRPLADTEHEMMERYVLSMRSGSLLCDLVDAETVGLQNVIRVMRGHPEAATVGVRIDSGNIAAQCVQYYKAMRAGGIGGRTIVFEDEVTPEVVRTVYTYFREQTGEEPTMLFPGAGGYWWRLVHRDTVAAAFKRAETSGVPNTKFSNSPGKESLPGRPEVYAQGDTLIVARHGETIDGDSLYVPLVRAGKIVYSESIPEQQRRAVATWGRFGKVELSPAVRADVERFGAMRAAGVAAARANGGES